ncbi:MAG: hypothetical protein LBS84_10115 [Clostridiales bacterium]|jgi:hypothetical protein|nr:hypothetical protein [Clostridiales bacterium]
MSEVSRKRPSYMNAAEVLDKVFDVYRRSLLYQIGLNFCVYTIGFAALYVILIGVVITGLFAGTAVSLTAGVSGTVILGVIGAAILIWLFIIYANLCAAACGFLSWQSYSGRPIDFSAALKNTFKSFGRIAALSLAELAAGIPLALLLCAALFAAFADQVAFIGDWTNELFYSLFTFRNLLLLFAIAIPVSLLGVIAYNYCALALPAAVFDRKYFFEAIISSYRLMKGDFWRILGIRVVFAGAVTLINYSLSSLSSALLGTLTALSDSFSPNQFGLMTIGVVVQYAVSFITGVLLMPLSSILTSILFFNQKIKKESLDLAMRLEILERTNGL